jgi:menaquinone-dependent protoporphyrinogen oxidase
MKPIGVFYATREGQTQRIAENVSAILRVHGLGAQVRNVQLLPATFNLNEYAAVILAASVHAGQHESEMVRFVKKHVVELDRLPTAFLSVTLSQAGAERKDTRAEEHTRCEADVNKMLDHFFDKTGWHPKHVKPVAGALLYTKYNFIVRLIMKRIAKKAGAETDTSRDYEYTDWASLNRFVAEFADELCHFKKERDMPLPNQQGDTLCRS